MFSISHSLILYHSYYMNWKDDVAQCAHKNKWTKTFYILYSPSQPNIFQFTPIGFLFVYHFDLLWFCSYISMCVHLELWLLCVYVFFADYRNSQVCMFFCFLLLTSVFIIVVCAAGVFTPSSFKIYIYICFWC